MDNNTSDQQSLDQYNGIDLRELFNALWLEKIKIIAITAVFAVAAIIYALSVPDQYRASALLAPAQSDGGDLSGALGQLGGLASLAGVSLGGGQTSETQIAKKIMLSRSFIEDLINENKIDFELAAISGWDKEANKLLVNSDVYDQENMRWILASDRPSGWALFKSFSGRVSMAPKSGLVAISFDHYSPYIAKRLLDMYVTAINKHMQKRQIDKLIRNIDYLEVQIEQTSVVQIQEAFYRIIAEQLKNKMLAEASPEYIFTTVSPSMVPIERFDPNRAMICVRGTLMGGILSIFIVLGAHYIRKLRCWFILKVWH